jgi:hypothetical protein
MAPAHRLAVKTISKSNAARIQNGRGWPIMALAHRLKAE